MAGVCFPPIRVEEADSKRRRRGFRLRMRCFARIISKMAMPRNAGSWLCVVAFCLVLGVAAVFAQTDGSAPQADNRYPWASSLPFDLEPSVAQASFNLRSPSLRALYGAIASN